MIVRILSAGKSFKGLANYLTHDPNAETAERVGWTHTHNLAHDDAASAVDEMLWTARDAELLKQEAGIRAGGRATENPVKHVSLNWSPDDTPTRDHMIKTTESFLGHMGWQDHQALLVAHEDKAHAHVHLMLNVIHPETGLRLDDGFEQRRAQAWALEYEREQGRIHCGQRLKNAADRDNAPTRDAWLAFQITQQEFERGEGARRADPVTFETPRNSSTENDQTWQILKAHQRDEREQFFAGGKLAFSELRLSIYREVREDFRDRWADYYAARRDRTDAEELAALKAALLADQKASLEARRDAACGELRESRDGIYRDLLDQQRELRAGLRWHQEAGLDNARFLERIEAQNEGQELPDSFRAAANEVTTPSSGDECLLPEADSEVAAEDSSGGGFSANVGNIGISIGWGLLSIGDSVFAEFIGAKPGPRERHPGPDLFKAAAEVTKQQQEREQDEADQEARRRQRDYARE